VKRTKRRTYSRLGLGGEKIEATLASAFEKIASQT